MVGKPYIIIWRVRPHGWAIPKIGGLGGKLVVPIIKYKANVMIKLEEM
jgi:hypothetical protein